MDDTGERGHAVQAIHNAAGVQCIGTETTVDGIARCSGIESATLFSSALRANTGQPHHPAVARRLGVESARSNHYTLEFWYAASMRLTRSRVYW